MESVIGKSPYTSYLQTNYAPSNEQAAQIQEFLSSDAILAHGQRIDNELARLLKAKADYDRFIQEHKSLSSRIRRLPLDIWRIIFAFCLPTKSYPSMSPFEMPAVLTRVCKSWRTIALETPELWSKLYIPLPSYPREPTTPRNLVMDELDDDSVLDVLDANEVSYEQGLKYWEKRMDQRRRMLEIWLGRAGKRLLSFNILDYAGLSFNYGGGTASSTPEGAVRFFARPMKDIIDLLQRYSNQWGHLEMTASYPFIHTLFKCSAPNLQYLRINNSSSEMEDILRGEMILLSDYQSVERALAEHIKTFPDLFPLDETKFPNLRTLFVKTLHEDILRLPVNWSNITEIFFDKYTLMQGKAFGPTEALALMRETPRLQKCHFVLRRFAIQSAASETELPLELADLHHISIHEAMKTRAEGTNELFRCLVTPALRTLVFTTSIPPSTESNHAPQPIFPLLEMYGSQIRTLAIDYRSWTIGDLERLLPLVNDNLEELWLNVGFKATDPNDRLIRRWRAVADPQGQRSEKRALLTNAFLANMFIPDMKQLSAVEEKNNSMVIDGSEPNTAVSRTTLSRKFPKLKLFYCGLQSAEFTEEALLDFVRTRRSRRALNAGVIDNYIEKVVVRFAMRRPMENMDERLAEFAVRHEKQLGLKSTPSGSDEKGTMNGADTNPTIQLPSWEDYCDLEEKRNPGVFASLFNDPDLDLGPGLVTFTRPYDDFLLDDEFDPESEEVDMEEKAILTQGKSDAKKLIMDVTWPADYTSLSIPHIRPVHSHRGLGWGFSRGGRKERVDYGTWSPSWRMSKALDYDLMSSNSRKTCTGVTLF